MRRVLASDPPSSADPFAGLPANDLDRAVLVRLTVDPTRAELVADRLFEAGAIAVEERDTAGRLEIVTGFGNRSIARDALATLEPTDCTAVVVELPDDTWFDGWRAYARPHRVGERLVIRPSWLDPADEPARPGDLVIELDPGRAFGSGAHPTSRGVLAELERLIVAGSTTVVDVGSGSGVLAVGAALLGAARVVAVDIDPEARRATAENAERNRVEVEVFDDVADLDEQMAGLGAPDVASATVVAANIGGAALVGLAPTLSRFPVLILAGFFASAVPQVTGAYPTHRLDRRADDDGWAILTLVREPAAGPLD